MPQTFQLADAERRMTLEYAVNYYLASGYKEESRDGHRVVMVKHRLVCRDTRVVLTQIDGQVYRRLPGGGWQASLTGPHF